MWVAIKNENNYKSPTYKNLFCHEREEMTEGEKEEKKNLCSFDVVSIDTLSLRRIPEFQK